MMFLWKLDMQEGLTKLRLVGTKNLCRKFINTIFTEIVERNKFMNFVTELKVSHLLFLG